MLYAIVSDAAIVLCFVPFLLLFWKKMRQEKAYFVAGIYWLANGLVNLPDLDLIVRGSLIEKAIRFYNLLDTPLILLMFSFAASRKNYKRQLQVMLILFVAFEFTLLGWKGYNFNTSALIIGAGILLVMICCITGLIQFMKEMEHSPFENSMACIYGALLFVYGCFLFLYTFVQLRRHEPDYISSTGNRDGLLLYYVALLLSASITSLGLWSYGLKQPAGYSSSSS